MPGQKIEIEKHKAICIKIKIEILDYSFLGGLNIIDSCIMFLTFSKAWA